MSVSAIKNIDQGINSPVSSLSRDLKAQIIFALASVVESYLNTVQANYDKIAEQDANDRRVTLEEGRSSAILNEKIAEESAQGSAHSVSFQENKNPNTQNANSSTATSLPSGSDELAAASISLSSTKA